jgi:hypothetical protein
MDPSEDQMHDEEEDQRCDARSDEPTDAPLERLFWRQHDSVDRCDRRCGVLDLKQIGRFFTRARDFVGHRASLPDDVRPLPHIVASIGAGAQVYGL